MSSGFWARLRTHAEAEWGPAGRTYQDALKRALSGGLGTEAESVARLKMVAFAQEAIQRLLQWPEERISQLRAEMRKGAVVPGPSRRGGL